jgi:glycine/D-amino acid oxidase-like deaminating enzyme
MHVCVVGAGIIGASISRHLAQRGGVKVTVLEAAPAPTTGATGASWAWLNANAKHPRHYRDLNLASMQLWQSQHTALCTFNGCLMLHDERAEAAADAAYPSRHVAAGAELQALAPGLDAAVAASCQHALLYAQEGWCDPAAATAAFLEDAHAAGARMLFSHKVCVCVWKKKATFAAC